MSSITMEAVMTTWNEKFRIAFFGVSIFLGLLIPLSAAYATEQAQQRREGRDVKQDTRREARDTKRDCRADDQKSNAGCRQDKRSTKQEGRQKARDIKY
jgi:hypothetical protein